MLRSLVVVVVCFVPAIGMGQDYEPEIAPSSDEPQRAMAGFNLPAGMQAEVLSAEPLLANPVAFKLDEAGRAYVCETYRQQRGVEDNRYHMNWLQDDLAAQFALVDRHCRPELEEVAVASKNQLARIHAIWGLSQLGRRDHGHVLGILALLDDADAEIRAQTARVLGDVEHLNGAAAKLNGLLRDPSARVRSLAAMSLGRQGSAADVPALIALLKENNDADPWLRHAAVMALVEIGYGPKHDDSAAVRRAIVLTLRRFQNPDVARFLHSSSRSGCPGRFRLQRGGKPRRSAGNSGNTRLAHFSMAERGQ